MDVFEYLPQLIVAYDGNDEFANLIHVKKANKNNSYYCPCCGGVVKPRAITSTKEQSHYYHISGKCTKESQLHFFCKNWLFKKGSKFYINEKLFEVASIEIEKIWYTSFGNYKPDITVYTSSDDIIYFEMFFSSRKIGDDYFCKWNALGNDVVEVNIKEYLYKTDENIIPVFTYLYHDGVCYSKTYEKRDLYASIIAKIKHELTRQKVLNYKARIEQLDWFWQKIIENATRDDIINCIYSMTYEDMISCYEIIKRKQCVSYLKQDVLDTINQKIIGTVRDSISLPFDENVYFDIRCIRGRTYEVGIRLKIQTEHIVYNNFYLHCNYNECSFKNLAGYPKIVFKKNIFTIEEIKIPNNKKAELKDIFYKTIQFKNRLIEYEKELSDFESNNYKIKFNNNLYTVLKKTHDNKLEPILENYHLADISIESLSQEIRRKSKEQSEKRFFFFFINSEKVQTLISDLQNNGAVGFKVYVGYKKQNTKDHESRLCFDLHIYGGSIYSKILSANEEDFLETIKLAKIAADRFIEKYSEIIDLASQINNCKNGFWNVELLFDYNGILNLKIDQTHINSVRYMTYEKFNLSENVLSSTQNIYCILVDKMKLVMKNMEQYGYRAMEVNH